MGLRSILSQSHGSMLARHQHSGGKEKRPDKRTESHGAVGREVGLAAPLLPMAESDLQWS
jgi:hypothetical protein